MCCIELRGHQSHIVTTLGKLSSPQLGEPNLLYLDSNSNTVQFYLAHDVSIKATSWSTNDDITDAQISATIQQILTKFSAVVSYVKQRQIGKFQLICTWVTMLSKYIILQYGGKSRSKNKNKFCLIYLCICW